MLTIKERKTEITNLKTRFLRAPTLKEYLDKITIKDGKKKFTGLHKLLSDPEFLMLAYNNLNRSKDLTTTGKYFETLESLPYKKIKILAKQIHTGTYQSKPVR